MMASYPALFSSVPKNPCYFASPTPNVNGDFATKACPFPPVGAIVPLSGPVVKISGFSGLNGSVPGVELSKRRRIPSPIPPMYFLAYSSLSGLVSVLPLDKSTCRILRA